MQNHNQLGVKVLLAIFIITIFICDNAMAIRVDKPKNQANSTEPRTFKGNNIANHLVFEVIRSKSREKALKYFTKQLSKIKGHTFGIYEEGINNIVIQSNISDSRILLEHLANNFDKNADYKFNLMQNITILGAYGFKFDQGGVLMQIRCRSKYDVNTIKNTINIEGSVIQVTQDGNVFIVWIPKNKCNAKCSDEIESKLNSNKIEFVVDAVTEVGKRYN